MMHDRATTADVLPESSEPGADPFAKTAAAQTELIELAERLTGVDIKLGREITKLAIARAMRSVEKTKMSTTHIEAILAELRVYTAQATIMNDTILRVMEMDAPK